MKIIIKGAYFKDNNLESTTISKYYSVTYSGSGVSSSSAPKTIAYGDDNYAVQDLVANIKVLSSYTFNSVTSVSVGGKALSTSDYTVSGQIVTIPANKINGNVVITVATEKVNTGGDEEEPGTGGGSGDSGTTGNGQWLSVLVTGDKNAHTEFMNYTETIGELTNVPCAYVKPEIQKHLSGKRVTKVACYVLGSNSSISFYTNNYSQSGTTSGDWTKVFTLTDPSSKVASGTKTKKEYNVNFTIEEGDTLAFYDMVKMNSPANKPDLMSYVLPVSYTMNVGGKYGTALPNFIAFDFYVE